MKIALALRSFGPHRGDLGAFTFELARRLVSVKNDVHVVAEDFSVGDVELPVVAHRIRATRSPLRRAAAAEAELDSIGADVVHDLGLTWCADVHTSPVGSPTRMWNSQLTGTPWWRRPFKRLGSRLNPRFGQRAELARRQLEDSDAIIVAESEMVADDYRSLHGIAEDRIRVVHTGIDIKKFSPHVRKLRRETTRRKLGIDGKTILLLSLMEESQQGTWKTTFRALRRLVAKQVPVALVLATSEGMGPVERLADRFNVAKHVQIIDKVSDRIPFYAAADALLAPTLYSPFGAAVLEAAACGLPCITTQQNGVSELLTDGTDGYVLERFSAVDLVERIKSLGDSSRLERMGRAARRTAMAHPFDRSVARLLQIYEEVAETRGGKHILAIPNRSGRTSPARRAA